LRSNVALHPCIVIFPTLVIAPTNQGAQNRYTSLNELNSTTFARLDAMKVVYRNLASLYRLQME
jgi:hypothetical protein